MDPVQRLYMTIQQENNKIAQTTQLIQSSTGDLQKAYSTIQGAQVSTVAGLTTTIHQYISTSLS